MSIEGLTTLSSFFLGDSRPATTPINARSSFGANVIALAVPEDNVSNRAIKAYSGALPPQMGSDPIHDEKDSHPFYAEEEDVFEEEDEKEDKNREEDWDDLDREETHLEEDFTAEEEFDMILAAYDRGVFLDCCG